MLNVAIPFQNQNAVEVVVNCCALFVRKLMACVKIAVGTRMNMWMTTTETQPEHTEIIWFVCKENGYSKKKKAYKIGNWLLVSFTEDSEYKIYRADTGKPFSATTFASPSDAVKIAQLISSVFEKYFDLWTEFPTADVVGLAKWSVKNGIEIYEILKSMPTKVKSMEDIENLYNSKSLIDKVKGWYNGRFTRRSA